VDGRAHLADIPIEANRIEPNPEIQAIWLISVGASNVLALDGSLTAEQSRSIMPALSPADAQKSLAPRKSAMSRFSINADTRGNDGLNAVDLRLRSYREAFGLLLAD
jgi:hypothetical protein